MPIHKKPNDPLGSQSITNRGRALELFTDRVAERRRFARYVNEEPPPNHILCFHGDGGNGKSLLLDVLERDYCHRVSRENWNQLHTIQKDRDFIEAFSQTKVMSRIPSARLDFGAKETGDDRPREDWSGLLMLRRELGPKGFYFPTFDLGITLYLYKTRQLSKANLKNLFPQEESDLAAALIDLITEGAYANLALKIIGFFDKTFQESMTLFMQKRGVDQALVERLTRMDPQAELRDELPHLLGRDLNTSLQLHERGEHAFRRVVLFFDTHEAFWGNERLEQSPFSYFQRDEWLRRLVDELYNPNYGVIVLVAGRESPRWAEPNAGDWRIDEEYIDTQLIGQLNREDAHDYLSKSGITEADLRNSLISFAEVESNQVHPLYLGLCADVILEAEKRGERLSAGDFAETPRTEQKGRDLINRLLKYCTQHVRDAVEALAAAQAFDLPLYIEIGCALHLQVSATDFRELIKFSFIRRDNEQHPDTYRVHDLLRKLLAQIAPTETQAAHQALEKYYQTKAETDPFATVELIYHINQQDWKRGYDQWIKTFKEALKQAQYPLCEALIALRPVLIIEKPFECSAIAYYSGNLFAELSRHIAAEQAFTETVVNLDRLLALTPQNVYAHNNKGIALQSLGDLHADLSQHDAAVTAYREAIATLNQALALAPDDVAAHNNKGIALQSLGDLHADLSQHDAAVTAYREAIATLNRALALAPDDVAAQNTKGIALQSLGDLHTDLSQHDAAVTAYREAIAAYDCALALAPEYVKPHINKGSALIGLGKLQADVAQHAAAESAFREAIATFDRAFGLAPDDVAAHHNKGNALQSLGALHTDLSQYDAAATAYREAIAVYDCALALAPEGVNTHINKGNALRELGKLQADLAQHAAAESAFREAFTAYDCALALAPESVSTHNHKGNALIGLGKLQADVAQHTAAESAFREAIATFNRALALAPDDVLTHKSKGHAHKCWGNLQAALSQHDAATINYRKGIAILDRILSLCPEDVAIHINKSDTLLSLGDLHTNLSQHDAAAIAYRETITILDRAFALAPNCVAAHNNKGAALRGLAGIHHQKSERDLACFYLQEASKSLHKALSLAPDHPTIIQESRKVKNLLNKMYGDPTTP